MPAGPMLGGSAMRSLAILPALAVALAMVDGAASQTKTVQSSASAERIAHLIDQLGSLKHAERVRATKDLEDIGAAALSQLRKAMTSADAETQNRATSLVRKIEDQQITMSLLAPKRVHLKLKDANVADAVAELAKQSGYPVELTGDIAALAGSKV